MVTRGRGGNSRGRGARGRGAGTRGRGRGHGSSFSRYGPNRRFDSARLADIEGSDSEESEGDEDVGDDSASDDADSDSGNDDTPARPYMTLLQSFSESNAPNAKRRKIEHSQSSQQVEKASSPSADGDDDDAKPDDENVDLVEEQEDDTAESEEQLDDESDDSDDEESTEDPFVSHFEQPDDVNTAKAIRAVKDANWVTKRALLQSLRTTLQSAGPDSKYDAPQGVTTLDSLKLKQKLKAVVGKKTTNLKGSQQAIAPLLFQYRDILYCDRTVQNSNHLRQTVCLHALNHVFKTRDRVIKNSYRLAKEEGNSELELRDQGFTRPKVLFLLPTRNACTRVVNVIRDLCEPDQQENRKRFDESYVDKEAHFGADRPADFRELFEGNDDDMFRIGIKFTRKTIKYFSQFYSSDILLASPLGLRMAIGSEEDKKPVDYDFLSSIEMVVVDQADALLMQNWEHVEYIFEHLNLQPKDAHGCDFSRVRNWYLEDWAKYFRQTIIMSGFNTPELSELQRVYCHNWAGKARLQPEYNGVINQLGIKAKQTFSRFQSPSVEMDPDARFEYFTSAIIPSLVKRSKDATGTLIFIPSYLDFVRIRNYFANSAAVSNVTFGAVSEYSDVPEASRARSHFVTGRHRVLLYTERAHHFRRYQFGGVRSVIFYGLPDNPIFYQEIAGGFLSKSERDFKIEPGQGTVRVIFSKYDVMKLERVAGSKRVGKMIQDRGDTFDFI